MIQNTLETPEEYSSAVHTMQLELQKLYDKRSLLEVAAKLELVEELVGQIGEVDLDIEGLKNSENQRDLSIRFHWGHNHRFSENVYVPGRMGDRHLNLMAQFMVRKRLSIDHFNGKNVIDVGCWTGGTTFLLKVLGAQNILALEEVQKYAKAANRLLKDIYEFENITCDGTNLYDLEATGSFDIAYFPGVIYHLSDPVLALRRLFNALNDGGEIFVESAGLNSENPVCQFEGNRVFHNASSESEENFNRGGWNWFLPSPSCLERWMIEAGFENVDCFYSSVSNRVFGYGRRARFVPITKAGFSRPDID